MSATTATAVTTRAVTTVAEIATCGRSNLDLFMDPDSSVTVRAHVAERMLDRMGDYGIFVEDAHELDYMRACRKLGAGGYSDLAGSMISYMTVSGEFSYT